MIPPHREAYINARKISDLFNREDFKIIGKPCFKDRMIQRNSIYEVSFEYDSSYGSLSIRGRFDMSLTDSQVDDIKKYLEDPKNKAYEKARTEFKKIKKCADANTRTGLIGFFSRVKYSMTPS